MFTFTWDERAKGDSWVSPHTYGDSLSSTSLATYVGLGVFEGYIQNSQLRSIYINTQPTTSTSQNNFYNAAVYNRNWQYNNQLPMTYAWYVMQLYFVKGDRNTQNAYGNGLVSLNTQQEIISSWSATDAWNKGTTANQTTAVTALGIQNAWGNVRKFMGEMRYNNGTVKFSTLGGKDHYNIESGTANTWKSLTTTYKTSAWARIQSISGDTPEYPFFPISAAGTSYNTDYADGFYSSSSTARCVLVGGYYYNGFEAGALNVNVNNATSVSSNILGARLHVLII